MNYTNGEAGKLLYRTNARLRQKLYIIKLKRLKEKRRADFVYYIYIYIYREELQLIHANEILCYSSNVGIMIIHGPRD